MNVPEFGNVPPEYSASWLTNMIGRLRVTFNQLNTYQPILAGQMLTSKFPTDVDYAELRSGEVYIDTTASNVLKVKP